jgi:hypothetical protein
MKKLSTLHLIALACATGSTFAYGASYDTLPKGVDLLAVKQVVTSKIQSKYDGDHADNSLALSENFTSSKLESISSAMKSYFNELKAISPDAYNQFSLGEFKADAYAQATAQGLGLAHGITDHLTVYGSIPVYHIKTDVTFRQSQKSTLAAVQSTVANAPTNSALSTFVRQLTQQIPETNEQLLQSMVVNYYGYKALGTWKKDALGDAELGAIYRLTDFYDKGFAVAFGTVLPTGDADDPDSLQDVSTGDGQYDAFVESMGGVSFFDGGLQFDLKARFTYQFASNKVMRRLDDPNVPLSKDKETMSEKLGNKIDSTFTVTVNPVSWFNVYSSVIYSETGATTYGASDPRVKATLEKDTIVNNYWGKVGVGFSTVELYKAKKMDIPCEIGVSAQRLLNAKNAANYERFDLDFKLYF